MDEEYDAHCIEVTGWTLTASSTSSASVSLFSVGTSPLTSNTLGPNLRKGDHLFVKTSGELIPIGTVSKMTTRDLSGGTDYTVTLTANAATVVTTQPLFISFSNAFVEDPDAILNRTWVYPYASGGFRDGDTVVEHDAQQPTRHGGALRQEQGRPQRGEGVEGFTGGAATLTDEPRSSVPLENFLIGKTCIETAQNFAQHVNKTIEENYKALGLSASDAPTVAYVDPYLADDDHARVLLYDVAHDREFIAFQDIFMQVQTSAKAVEIGWPQEVHQGRLPD